MSDLGRFSGPGGWNDPDMLVVGLNNTGFIKGGGCNDIEYRTQMSMWCMFSAPLMMGCDVRNMNETTKTILLNKEIIAIDQDSLGKQAYRVWRKDGLEVWKKPLSGGKFAVALLNRNSSVKTLTVSWKDIEMDPTKRYDVYDVWKHATAGSKLATISSVLQPHETNVFVLKENK
jgi:alpha-galactosidase